MRREWPLLVGLVLSAGLVFWSTQIGGSVGAKPKSASASGAGAADVQPSSVPAAQAPATQAKPKAADERPERAKPTKRPNTKESKADGSGAGAATSAPSAPSSGGGGSSSDGASSAPKPTPQAPSGPRVVEVTGKAGQNTRDGVVFRCDGGGHSPVSGADWTLDVRASKGGRGLSGEVRVDVVHQGKVVGHIDTGRLRNGRYTHTVQWPPESVGHPLTLKVSTTAGGTDQTFLYKISVRRS